jgi:AcrR family transcriptional regulator
MRNHDSVCNPIVIEKPENRPAEQVQMTRAAVIASVVQPDDAGRSLRADARRNRQALIDAARKLFADQGLEAQVPDLARAANVGVGTVYRHFPTKDHLIAAIAAQHFDRMAERAREDLELADPWDGICDLIRFAVQLQADDRGLCEVMGSRPDIMDATARAAGLPELCDELVKRAQGSGQLRSDLSWEDIPLIACGIGHITHGSPAPSVGRWPRLLEITLDGLRAPGSRPLPGPL